MGRQIFFPEHVAFLKEINVWGITYKELTDLFNNKFETSRSVRQIYRVCSYRNLILGRVDAHIPLDDKSHAIGTERKVRSDYVLVKTAHPQMWRLKHHVVWETAHGPIPDGHVIIFVDGNRYNFALDNLILASKQEVMIMNAKKLFKNHAGLTLAGLQIARVYLAMRERFQGDPELGVRSYREWLRKHRGKWRRGEGEYSPNNGVSSPQ